MTAADPVASRLLDRTGVCDARRGTLSQREKVTGRAFDSQIGSTKRGDRYADCRIRTGFAFDRHICYATGDREWSSGESRLRERRGLDLWQGLPQARRGISVAFELVQDGIVINHPRRLSTLRLTAPVAGYTGPLDAASRASQIGTSSDRRPVGARQFGRSKPADRRPA